MRGECHRASWKKGHKALCRPLKELKTGDLVVLVGLDKAGLNEQIRQLGGYDESKGRWMVTWFNGSNALLIKPGNFYRVLTVEEVAIILRQD
ncbi:hypothetical protein HDU98_007210 [Podochytrium sp. JEL0797]|nr:hypothetical protein HDU98_007210 [Podochytrium sp. JEL0797]